MTLRYEFGWDFARALDGIGASVVLDDDGPSTEITPFTTGTYCHTSLDDMVFGDGSYDDFASALQGALNTASTGAGSYTVTFSASTGYTIAYDAGNFSLTFSTCAIPTQGSRMRAILGMTGDRSGAATYSSQARPYFLILPAIAGRSDVSDDYEPDSLASEAIGDDGTGNVVGPTTAEKRIDWQQPGDQDLPSIAYTSFGTGTPIHKRYVTSAVPWSYEHAWEHARTAYDPILVADSGTSENLVCSLRAEGARFKPRRMGGQDYDLWSSDFKVRLIGRGS